MSLWAIGIDLGGTAIKAAVVCFRDGILLDRTIPTDTASGPSRIVNQIAAIISSLYTDAPDHLDRHDFSGIGLGAPGAVDTEKGTLSYPPNLPGWTTFALREALEESLREMLPEQPSVLVENDANAAAYGEAVYGAGRNFRDFLMVTLGTGVGGGIVLERKLYRGLNGTAGEIGFMIVDFEGESMHAGIRGTIEGMIGKERIVDYACSLMRSDPEAWAMLSVFCNNDCRRLSPRHIEQAAKAGDALSLAVWERTGAILGIGFANVVALMDIRKFVVGGGISAAGSLILEPAYRQLIRSTLPSMHGDIELVQAELGNRAGMFGAAALCFV